MPDHSNALGELVARARHGDAEAMSELLWQVRPDVLRACARLLPNPEDAEEAAQDVLLLISRRIDTFEERGSFRSWMYTVVANCCRSRYRRLRRRAVEQLPLDVAITTPDPMRTSVIAGTRLDLLDALETLDGRTNNLAMALVLRDFCGLSYREVSLHLGIPISTARSRIHDARQIMRELLRDQRR